VKVATKEIKSLQKLMTEEVVRTGTLLKKNPFIPHWPTPKQWLYLSLPHREAMYGGAAGGGKSDALLMAAAMYVDRPHYAALLFRNSFAQLNKPGALMDRAHEWFRPTAARWDDEKHAYRFPSGASISFGYLESAQDKHEYQSAEYQFIGFDELTQFRREDYLFLNSRLRRLAGSDIPVRLRSATNPGGFGHDWVLQRFIIDGYKDHRPFIPAKLEDNPYLDREEYDKFLQELDPYTRQQLREGNWFARPPGFKFRREWFEIVDEAPRNAQRVRWWDLAATVEPKRRVGSKLSSDDPDYTVGMLLARDNAGVYYIEDVVRGRWAPSDVKRIVVQTAKRDELKFGLDLEIWMEQEPGSSGVIAIDEFRLLLDAYTFHGLKSTGKKEVRANPAAAAAGARNIKLVQGAWISDFLTEAEQFPDPSVHDDQIDTLSGSYYVLARQGTVSNDDYVYGIWRCASCATPFHWESQKPCPKCGTKAPLVYVQSSLEDELEQEEILAG
jgi:predicted phage terminase large subunit-like protein